MPGPGRGTAPTRTRGAASVGAVPFLAGVMLGFSLIIAIGAQNMFVLRQGLRREHVLLVAAICSVSDAVLIVAGVSGVGAATDGLPWLVPVIRWAGAAFLVGYGLLAARRALAVSPLQFELSPAGSATTGPAAASVAATALALTWLNPHVYLDTVFLLGSVAGTHGDRRWEFAVGAALASLTWFTGLAYGARFLSPLLSSPRAWRVLDGAIAVVMVALGVSLVVS